MSWNRTKKNEMRSIAVNNEGKAYKCVLMLPGSDLLCVKEAISNKIINKRTQLYVVERDRTTANKIEKQLKKLGMIVCKSGLIVVLPLYPFISKRLFVKSKVLLA